MSKNYAIIIQFVIPLTKIYRSGAQRNNVYKRDAFVTSWRSHNRAWQPRRHDRLSETSGTLWIHRGVLTNQRCSLATGCGINDRITNPSPKHNADVLNCREVGTRFAASYSRIWSCESGANFTAVTNRSLFFKECLGNTADTRRNINVIIASKRCRNVVLT